MNKQTPKPNEHRPETLKAKVIRVVLLDGRVKEYPADEMVAFTDKIINVLGGRTYQRTGELYIHKKTTKEFPEIEEACFAEGKWEYWEVK